MRNKTERNVLSVGRTKEKIKGEGGELLTLCFHDCLWSHIQTRSAKPDGLRLKAWGSPARRMLFFVLPLGGHAGSSMSVRENCILARGRGVLGEDNFVGGSLNLSEILAGKRKI